MITEALLKFKLVSVSGEVHFQPFITAEDYTLWKEHKIEIYQSTGLYDKNGRLIYDGDMVNADVAFGDDEQVQFSGIVHFEEGAYYVIGSDYVCGLCNNSQHIEVDNSKNMGATNGTSGQN